MLKNTERDDRILRHVGLYRVSFRATMARLFFCGRTPGNVLRRLIDEQKLQSRAGLPGRLRYYQLTPMEAVRMGLPLARARPPKPQALLTHLSVLWHCCMESSDVPRRRLDRSELLKLFGAKHPKGAHIMHAGSTPRVYRVLVASPATPPRTIVKALRRRIEKVRKDPVLGPWIRNRQYAFLILAEGELRRNRLSEIIQRHALHTRAEITVEHAPSHRTAGGSFAGAKCRPRTP